MVYDVTLIPGDGVGPELAEATRRVLDATGVAFRWDVHEAGPDISDPTGTPLPSSVLDSIRRTGVVLKGPTATPLAAVLSEVDAVAVFEPAQGSAPRYAGLNMVNPLPMLHSGALLLRHLGESGAADRLERAIAKVAAEGKCVTSDMKRDRNDVTAVGTSQVADAVVARLRGRPAASGPVSPGR